MKPPFFVIGAPRSGTSYLVEVLDRHPEIFLTNETRVMTFFHRALTQWSNNKHALMTGKKVFLKTFEKHVPEIVRDFYRELGATEDMRWGDKFPHYADSKTDPELPSLINRAFPRSQFVHITRDGRDVVASLIDKGWADFDEACDVWSRHVEASRVIGNRVGPERYFEFRYDDLVTQGPKTISSLLEFLGLENAGDVTEFLIAQEKERTPFSGATTEASGIGKHGWQKKLTAQQISAFNSTFGPLLESTGYAVDPVDA